MTLAEEAERARLIDRIEALEARVIFLERQLYGRLPEHGEDIREYVERKYS